MIFKLAPIQDTSCFGFWSGALSWYAQTDILKHSQQLVKLFSLCAIFGKACCPSMFRSTLDIAHLAQVYLNDQAFDKDHILCNSNSNQGLPPTVSLAHQQLCRGAHCSYLQPSLALLLGSTWHSIAGESIFQCALRPSFFLRFSFLALQHCCTDHGG